MLCHALYGEHTYEGDMRHLLIVIYLCLFNGTTVALTKRRFGQCLPISLMVMPLVMYSVQFACGSFHPAYIIMLAYAILGIPIAIIRRDSYRENYLTLGLLAFLVVCGFILVLDYRNFLSVWDEMSYWGPMTKSMVRLDTFYTSPEARLTYHWEYPPYMQLFETMWCVYAGGYSEMACNYAIHTFMAGIIVPVIAENDSVYLERVRGGRISRLCRNLAMMILLMAFYLFTQKAADGGSTYGTIYKDIVTALLFAYGMILIARRDALRDWYGYLALILDGTALLMTKQMGMCYVMVVLFYYVAMYVVEEQRVSSICWARTALRGLRFIPLAVIPYGINHIWTAYARNLGYVGQFDLGQIRLSDILTIAQDTYCETPQRQAFNSYIDALFSRDLFAFTIPVSFLGSLVIVIVLLYVAHRLQPAVLGKGEMLATAAAFTCGTFGYALTMCLLYLFCYSEGEMLGWRPMSAIWRRMCMRSCY